jgi:hypothetical protein
MLRNRVVVDAPANISVREIFRRFGADDWDTVRKQFAG